MKRDVFIVDPPSADAPGKYLLVVSRNSMFGSNTTAFAVDYIDYSTCGDKLASLRAYRGRDLIVEFSPEISFLMMDRTLVRPTNMTEIEIEDRRTAEEHKKIIEAEFPPEAQDAVATTTDGRQRINAQGYL